MRESGRKAGMSERRCLRGTQNACGAFAALIKWTASEKGLPITTKAISLIMSLFQLRQTVLLLITATIWGLSFVAQSVGMDHVGPFTFTASRMCLGALVLLPFIFWNRKRLAKTNPVEHASRTMPQYRKTLLLGSLACGLCLFGGESLQQFGLVHDTEVGKAGFITALYIVLVPLIGLALGRRTGWIVWAAVAVAIGGLWFLCVPPEGFSIRLGDFYTLLCAFVFSLHILVISHFVTRVNGVELACGQFVFGSLIATTAMLLTETPTWEGYQGAILPILWAGIMSNGIAYTLQIVGQRGMNETVASLIMSLESAIAVLAGWLLLGEVLSNRELFGCLLMAGAVVLAQLPAPKRRKAD